jgi:hypothetical protein
VINCIEAVKQKKKYIFAVILAIAIVVFFVGPARTYYVWDKTVSFIRIPLQKVIRPSVHPWGYFASTSPVVSHEVINGIEVPPLPGLMENRVTLLGLDLNQDGVRDDIERYIAEQYGNDEVHYPAIREYVHAVEYALENSKSATADRAADKAMTCFPRENKYVRPYKERKVFNTLELVYFSNTNERAAAFIKAFAGKSGYGCDWYTTHKID